jgi:aspartyl/asparaginyl beta-hydroxylase (cupin superfamily)
MSKISDEEFERVQNNRTELESIGPELAELLLQKVILEDLIEKLQITFLEKVSKEKQFFVELNKKYGEGLLDMETGEITS